MTTPSGPATPEPQPEVQVKRRLKIEPEPEGRLEQLLILNKRAADAQTVAKEAADEYKLAIKSWLLDLLPADELPDAFDIVADARGRYPGYTMTLKGGWRLDTERMKAEAPETYVAYAKQSTPTWELRESQQGRGRRR